MSKLPEQAANHHPRRAKYKQFLKKVTHRIERQRVRWDIESPSVYRRFIGYEN